MTNDGRDINNELVNVCVNRLSLSLSFSLGNRAECHATIVTYKYGR